MPAATPTSLSFVQLLLDAGWIAKLVLLALLLQSIASWALIFTKWRILSRAHRENGNFLAKFWQSKNVDQVYEEFETVRTSPIATTFKSGMKELRKTLPKSSPGSSPGPSLEPLQRALVRSSNTEIAQLERNLSWLATTASAAPFIGLFGTVWGIMTSFQNIGASGGANLAVVAPGIAEALIATAAGIGVAIPAVMAYNHFLALIRRITVDLDAFIQDFMNLAERSLSGSPQGKEN